MNSMSAKRQITLTIVYNNVAYDTNLKTGWGMSCVIQGTEKCILFDTGSDGPILLKNMELLGITPQNIDIVFLSHIHWDHTGGLYDFLKEHNNVEIFLLSSSPDELTSSITEQGGRFTRVTHSVEICRNVYSTGEMEGMGIKEHALIIDTKDGLVVITGCAHPGVVNIAAKAKELRKKEVNLLLGGFHLTGMSDQEIRHIIVELQELGVQKVGPSHCTGDRAIELFQTTWKDNFINLSLGARFKLETT